MTRRLVLLCCAWALVGTWAVLPAHPLWVRYAIGVPTDVFAFLAGWTAASTPMRAFLTCVRLGPEVKYRANDHCAFCSGHGSHPHHVMERKYGGNTTVENLRWICLRCHWRVHHKKGLVRA